MKKQKKVSSREIGLEIGLIVVDYMQRMREPGKWDHRCRELSESAQGLKSLAKEMNVPILALSQLSRRVEERRPPIPEMSDLRESGDLEQEADAIMLLYRPEYYKRSDVLEEEKNMAKVFIAKNREGATGVVKLTWRPERSSFASFGHRDRHGV